MQVTPPADESRPGSKRSAEAASPSRDPHGAGREAADRDMRFADHGAPSDDNHGTNASRGRVRRVPADPFFPLDLNQVASANDCTGLAPAKVDPETIPGENDEGHA